MTEIELKTTTQDGSVLTAIIDPEKGMSLLSFRKDKIEIMAQSTKEEFLTRRAGLGVLIGPHFHRRNPSTIPSLPKDASFFHLDTMKKHGSEDPFTHGIGRYAPWTAKRKDNTVTAVLKGDDTWNGVTLKDIEGQDFTMQMIASLQSNGLHLSLSIVSETASLVGAHYYYALARGKGEVIAEVQADYLDMGVQKPIPSEWNEDKRRLRYSAGGGIDATFHPYPDPTQSRIKLVTDTHELVINSSAPSEETSWQLWQPEGAHFICIEPTSAYDPRHANLTVSKVDIHLQIHN